MRFLQIHLSMSRGGAHSSVLYLKKGLESLGHRCDVFSLDSDKIHSLSYDLVIFHSFSLDRSELYSSLLDGCRRNEMPRALLMHDFWPICHQTNMVKIGQGLTRCEENPCDVMRCGWSGTRQPEIFGIRDEHIVCFTERAARIFGDRGFSRTHVIPHGIDVSLFHPKDVVRGESFDVLFTNAWGEKDIKGYRHWEWVKKNAPMGIQCNQTMGGTRLEEMPKTYSAADATFFPSLWEETFGLTVIESLACGTPVISYPVGVAPDVIEDGVNGFLVPDSNPKTALSLMKKMSEMSDEETKMMRESCRASVATRFSMEEEARQYIDLAKGFKKER